MPFCQFSRNWPISVSAALQNSSQDFFFLLYNLIFTYLFRYETIVRSSALSFGHSDPDPSSVTNASCVKNFNLAIKPSLKLWRFILTGFLFSQEQFGSIAMLIKNDAWIPKSQLFRFYCLKVQPIQ